MFWGINALQLRKRTYTTNEKLCMPQKKKSHLKRKRSNFLYYYIYRGPKEFKTRKSIPMASKGKSPLLKELLIKTLDTTVYIQKSKGTLACFFIVSGATTAQFRSKACLELGMETPAIQTNCTIPEGEFHIATYKANKISTTAMLRLIGMAIGQVQDIKIKGCNTSK